MLERRRKDDLLGTDIGGLGGFDFDIEIHMGSGAYVCGEETALIESLEGHRGEPRNRPPFPVDTGFIGQPTVVNNVETLRVGGLHPEPKGAEWFKRSAPTKSTGHKLFSVSGDCASPGVYEFPLGITVAELLEAVGGEGAKAVQVGGASGHCVPAPEFGRTHRVRGHLDRRLDHRLRARRDMLRVAKNFMEFFVEESCGQCTPCREGNAKLLEGVEMLERGGCSMATCTSCALARRCSSRRSAGWASRARTRSSRSSSTSRTRSWAARLGTRLARQE